LLGRRALDVEAKFLAAKVRHLGDVLGFERVNDRRAFLEQHGCGDKRKAGLPGASQRGNVGDREGRIAGCNGLNGNRRALACDDFEIDPGVGEPSLLPAQVKERMLGSRHPIQPDADLLGSKTLRAENRDQKSAEDNTGKPGSNHRNPPILTTLGQQVACQPNSTCYAGIYIARPTFVH
jgi:hypothetical protein